MADDFSKVIAQKISVAQSKIQDGNKLILSPQHHAGRVTNFLQSKVGEINPEADPQEVISALLGVINGIPKFIGDGFSDDLATMGVLKQELNVWAVVAKEWKNCEEQQALRAMRAKKTDELIKAVDAEDVEERTTQTRRKMGDHPGPSTRDLRKAKAQLREPGS